jgi:hypothetical protein
MFFLETKITPTVKQQKLIQDVFGGRLPWYHEKSTSNYKFFSHVLMARNENLLPLPGVKLSSLFESFENIFIQICQENNIKNPIILRASINNTYHYSDVMGDVHIDHAFPHYNMIWYLDDDTGSTYIFDKKKENIIKKIEPKKNKVIIFSGEPHAQGFCKVNENRTVVVFTFIKKEEDKKMNKYRIRFNKSRGQEGRGTVDHVWRVFDGNKEYLVKHFKIYVPSQSEIEENGTDWNVVCNGVLILDKDTSTAIINEEI